MTSTPLTSARLVIDADSQSDAFAATYGDGLPVVAPTEARVRRFVEAVGLDPGEVVAVLPPARGAATVEKVAINAVMAGCTPAQLPLVIAAVRAVADPRFNAHTLQVSSNPVGVLLVVNGPVRVSAAIGSGANCMGYGRANLSVGRALRFVLLNIGGATPGAVDMACQGFPGKLSMCFGENEDESPWAPLHAERGFPPDRSTVTAVAAQGTTNIAVHGRPVAEDILPALARGMINPSSNNYCAGGGEPVLALNPGHARRLASDGVTKDGLRQYLYENARVPIDWYTTAAAEARDLHSRVVDGHIPVADSPEQILVVVTGAAGTHSTYIPTFGDTIAITVEVR